MVALFWALWIASAIARGLQWPSLWPMSLWGFKAFLLAILMEDGVFMWRIAHGMRNQPIQEMLVPYMAALKLAVAIEAAWWLARSLPNFSRLGLALMGASAIVAPLAAAGFAPRTADYLRTAELTIGVGLLTFLALTLIAHGVFFTESASAMWHAGLFGLYLLSVTAGWYLKTTPIAGALCMWGGQIVAALLWIAMVRRPPNWKAPEAVGTSEDVDRAIRRMRGAFE